MKKIYYMIFLSILISGYIFFYAYNNSQMTIKSPVDFAGKENPESKKGELVYKQDLKFNVNGESITSEDVDARYNKIPENARENLTKDQVLEALVDQKLILQEAGKKGITTTEEEIDGYMDRVKSFNKLDEKALEQQISAQGYTLEEYKKSIRDVLTATKLLDQELDLKNVQVSDSEVNDFIQQNKEEFSDFFSEANPDIVAVLKNRVKQKLTSEKQQQLVDDYLRSLKQNARINGG